MILKPRQFILPNRGHPLSKGLVGLWLMNERTGDRVFDLSGNGNIGTFGAGAASPTWASGKFGNSIQFVRANEQRITIPSLALSPKTVVVWAYLVDATTEQQIISFTYGGGSWRCAIGIDNTTGMGCCAYDGVDYVGGKGPFVAGWHQIALTCDGVDSATLQGYIDGVVTTDSGLLFGLSSTNGTAIGCSSPAAGGDSFEGKVSNLLFFDRILSASEIALLYREPFCMFERDEIELWSTATAGGLGTPLIIETWNASSEDGANVVENVDDNNAATYWAATSIANEWASADFGAGDEATITDLDLHSKADAADGVRVKNFKLQYSDNNSDWSDQESFQHTNSDGSEVFTVTIPSAHRYWRIYVTDVWGVDGSWIRIHELNFYGSIAAVSNAGFMTCNTGYWGT